VELSYEDALALLREHTRNENLVKHGMAVAAALGAYARIFGEDEVKWRVTGLLHDLDYEEYPTLEDHTLYTSRWLRERDYPEDVIHAILAHNDIHGDVRDDRLAHALFACDELTGLITATALVRPNKSIIGLEAGAVRKKMKDKAFARGVNRDDIIKGAEELQVPLDEHIAVVIAAMAAEAETLGLVGQEVDP
jgi:putative nucleotidyltransferase with HDIG domain